MAKRLDWDLANRKRRSQGHDGPPPDDAHVRGLRAKREILEAAGFRYVRKNSADEIEDLFSSLSPEEVSNARQRIREARDSDPRGRSSLPAPLIDRDLDDGGEGLSGTGGADLIRSAERQELLNAVRECDESQRIEVYEKTVVLFDAMSAKAVEWIESDESLSDEERSQKFIRLAAGDRRWKRLLKAASGMTPPDSTD